MCDYRTYRLQRINVRKVAAHTFAEALDFCYVINVMGNDGLTSSTVDVHDEINMTADLVDRGRALLESNLAHVNSCQYNNLEGFSEGEFDAQTLLLGNF